MTDRLAQVIQTAVATGLLPPDTTPPRPQGRPWPVVLLTALGAWLAALPLLIAVSLLLDDLLTRGVGPYLLGLLLVGLALVILRARSLALFVEQLAIPALLVGLGTLGIGLFRDLPTDRAAVSLAGLVLLLTLPLDRTWLRALLGAGAAGLVALALLPERLGWNPLLYWLAPHSLLLVWMVAVWLQHTWLEQGRRARAAAAFEAIGAGWLLTALTGLAVLSGPTFLAPGVLGPETSQLADLIIPSDGHRLTQLGSVLLALGAFGWLLRAWPSLRRPAVLMGGLGLSGLAWLLPDLGAALLALILTATTRRWRLATLAALAAIWILGSFYYRLDWSLTTKALVLIGMGAFLTLPLWLESRQRHHQTPATTSTATPLSGLASGLIVLTTVATLGVVNLGIWQKETLIADGMPLFVALAPVDPRSLLQGDYMRLRFDLPPEIEMLSNEPDEFDSTLAIVQRDARYIAVAWRPDRPDTPLRTDEVRLRLTRLGGRWGLVTDAWFFREGEAHCWQEARYGEFRVAPDGQALLVGLTDDRLQRLTSSCPPPERSR